MAAVDDMSLDESEIAVVLIHVVLLDIVRQPTHDKKPVAANADAARSMKDFLNFML